MFVCLWVCVYVYCIWFGGGMLVAEFVGFGIVVGVRGFGGLHISFWFVGFDC